ncbi:hypothetical protein [Metapseudomonas lalkuanensis]|uniref:hypothetical protein n=1 Tax=Metapseudomonas lalkuanensis TaxID=2604832 RepID=UPI0015B3AFD2|nr:hypothetical protein [Pseudomonas lalkuanensis]
MNNSNQRRPTKRGHFLKKHRVTAHTQRVLTPGMVGALASFHAGYQRHVAVLGQLDTSNPDTPTLKKFYVFTKLALEYTYKVNLCDWQRRLPTEVKRAFTMLGISGTPGASIFTFRLGHEVAEKALSASEGPAAHLAALIKRKLGIKDIAFILEYPSSTSDENHQLHLHGIACIPEGLTEDDIRVVLAPKPKEEVKGYRQRFGNKAIDLQPITTPGAWMSYISKEYLITQRKLGSAPDYASHGASRAGKELYEELVSWIKSERAREAPQELAGETNATTCDHPPVSEPCPSKPSQRQD